MILAIRGKVLSSPVTGSPLAYVTIQIALDMDSTPEWSTNTNGDGYFSVPLMQEDVERLFAARHHRELVFKVFAGTSSGTAGSLVFLGCQTSLISRATVRGFGMVELHVDPTYRLADPPSFAIGGYVKDADGTPRDGVDVTVYRKELRSETTIVSATTDSEGRFLIRYSGTPGGHGDGPDFSIRIASEDASATTDHICDAPAALTVLLTTDNEVYRGPSDFELDAGTLDPLLDTAEFHELTLADVQFLSCRTDFAAPAVARLARSHALTETTGLPAEAFVAFAHVGLPLTIVGLTRASSSTIEDAIDRAIAANVVPATLASDKATIVAALAAARVDRIVPATAPASTPLGSILVAAGLATGKPRAFAEAYAGRSGTIEEFWDDLRSSPTFGGPIVDKIQFSLQTGAISGGHAPLIKLLDQKRTTGDFSRAVELAKYDESDWLGFLDEVVDGTPVGAPSGFVGGDPTARKANYAAAMARMVADLYPSAHLAHRLPEGSVVNDIFAFIKDNPGFSFDATHITSFLPTAVGYPALPEDQEILRQDLLKVQRIFAISPRYGRTTAATALLDAGIHSAAQIRQMGYAAFNGQFGALMDEKTLTSVFNKAEQVASTVLNSWLLTRPEMNFPPVAAIPSSSSSNPEIDAILNSRDYCACPPCESVLGPAAYYCDILQFLFRRLPASAGFVVLASLRPELPYVDFSCENSETTLPTIDLINEVLEYAAFELLDVDGSPHVDRQTHWHPDDLLVYPEHIELGVYEQLADPTKACFPLNLPFDLAFEESRAYLALMGTSRIEIQDELQWFPGLDENDAFRVNERLGLSSGQASIIRNAPGTPALDVLWGFDGDGDWLHHFHEADTFLARTGLDLAGLRELLLTKDLIGHTVLDFAKPCTLAGAKLVLDSDHSEIGLDTGRIRMLQAFLRIKRAVGWTTPELDAVSRALDTTFISAGFDGLSQFIRIRRRFPRLPLGEVLSWVAPLDRTTYHEGDRSYYDEVVRPLVIDPAFVALNGSHTFAEFRGEILGILHIDDAGLDAAFAATGLTAGSSLNLVNLSTLYRVASLARAVHLSVPDLVDLPKYRESIDSVPGAFVGDYHKIRELLDLASAVTGAGFSVPEFDWVYRGLHQAKFGGDNISVMRVLISLIGALQQAVKDHDQSLPPATATALQQVERLLSGPLPAEEVAAAMTFLRKETAPEPDTDDFRKQHFFFLINGSDAATELDKTFGSAGEPEFRAAKVVVELTAWLRRQALERAVIQQLAGAFSLDVADTDALLRNFNVGGVALTKFTNDDFFALSSFDPEVDAPQVQDPAFLREFLLRTHVAPLVDLYRRLRRAAFLAGKFRLGPGLLQWLLTHPVDATVHLPDIAHFTSGTYDIYEAYLGFDWLRRAIQLRDRLFGSSEALIEVLDTIFVATDEFDKATALAQIAVAADWDGQTLTDFEGVQPVVQLDLKRLAVIEAFAAAFRFSAQLGVHPNTVRRWAKEDITTAVAAEIRNAARAKLGGNGWTAIAQPVRDQLRSKQRDALADFLVHKQGLKTHEDLFGVLLTDVDMAPCNRTTRILFATGAVQLFIQRALMGLYPTVLLTDADAAEWAWTKRYRVWEANRKVFLYPENWVVPELRDDKTQLFKRLEDELGQSEVDATSVDRAIIHYLEGLHEVSRLQPSGMYHEVETNGVGVDRMHVFAHSFSDPAKLFYRRRNTDAHWTGWEELPFQVDYGGSLPVMINGRLRLVWPHVQIKQIQSSTFKPYDDSTPTQKEVPEIGLAWSELMEEGWSGVRRSEDRVLLDSYHEQNDAPVQRDRIHLTSWSDGEMVTVRVNGRRYLGFFDLDHTDHFEGMADFTYNPCRDQFTRAGGFNTPAQQHIIVINQGLDWKYQGLATNAGGYPHTVDLGYTGGYDSTHPVIWLQLRTPSGLLFPRQSKDHDVTRPFVFTDEDVAFYMRPAPAAQGAEGSQDSQGLEDINKQDLVPYLGLDGLFTDYIDPPTDGALMEQLLGDGIPPVQPVWTPSMWKNGYEAIPFYHPYACLFIERVRRHGVGGLLDPIVATKLGDTKLLYQAADEALKEGHDYFAGLDVLSSEAPRATIDFSPTAAFSVYNWEIFFHIPMLVADRLMAERRFADAQRWLGYIFNPLRPPTVLDGGKVHFWGFKPFREASASLSIESLLTLLQYKGPNAALNKKKNDMIAQIEHSRANPFSPHDVARSRPTAYMRTVVMKYLDNLIAWGDDLFRQDTRESTQEAANLYILALQILGPRPRKVDGDDRPDKNWTEAIESLDEFSNFMVELENDVINFPVKDMAIAVDNKAQRDYQLNFVEEKKFAFVRSPEVQQLVNDPTRTHHAQPMALNGVITQGSSDGPVKTRLYFCIPPNDKLLAYWDTIADRLFKLRCCLNIDGVRRDLALYDPPIDPALLVKAAAQGIDIGTAIGNLYAPLPHYRFLPHLSIAKEFVAQVSSLGGAFLQAVEKRDAEALASLRTGHELELFKLMRSVKEQALREADENIEVTRRSREVAVLREAYYRKQSSQFMNDLEKTEVSLSKQASVAETLAAVYHGLAGLITATVPGISVGWSGPLPTVSLSTGGGPLAWPSQAQGDLKTMEAQAKSREAARTQTQAGYTRRREDWLHQASLATADIRQLDAQLTAAEIRRQLAELELNDLDRQIGQSTEVLEFMQSKFTNAELYSWMGGELAKFYNLAYQMALDLARRAERCYRYELATPGAAADFIQFGHWDNRRQGLLAGERLAHDVRRMEAAYYENNRREYELTKRISLASIDPVALMALRKTGACHFRLASVLFGLDHPSHYLRRIKLVSVALPAVTGPYTNVGVTLTYESGQVRMQPDEAPVVQVGTAQSVAISVSQDDTGLFEPNLRDERYLPFEGRGLEDSKWRLELPGTLRQFDYETITDVVVTVRYTAREGGAAFATTITEALTEALQGVTREEEPNVEGQVQFFSARAEFPEAWRSFVADGASGAAVLELDLEEQRFPHPVPALGEREITAMIFFVRWAADDSVVPDTTTVFTDSVLTGPLPNTPIDEFTFAKFKGGTAGQTGKTYDNVWVVVPDIGDNHAPGTWNLEVPGWAGGHAPEDIIVAVAYKVTAV